MSEKENIEHTGNESRGGTNYMRDARGSVESSWFCVDQSGLMDNTYFNMAVIVSKSGTVNLDGLLDNLTH